MNALRTAEGRPSCTATDATMSTTVLSQARRCLSEILPGINEDTIKELERRCLCHITERQWRFGDENNGTTRRFDTRKWKRADNSGPDWHRLIGLNAVHYLTFVNNFAKWDRRVQIGQAQLPPIELVRHELERTLDRLIELVGREWARRKFFCD
jgi:hypothetical protein